MISIIRQINGNGYLCEVFLVFHGYDFCAQAFPGIHEPGENNIVLLGNVTEFFTRFVHDNDGIVVNLLVYSATHLGGEVHRAKISEV